MTPFDKKKSSSFYFPNKLALAAGAALALTIAGCSGGGGGDDSEDDGLLKFSNFQPAVAVIGQADFTGSLPNRGTGPEANTLDEAAGNPYVVGGTLYVPDTSNNRVLGFRTIPADNSADVQADFVIGQDSFTTVVAGSSETQLASPYSVYVSGGKFFVADGNNLRIKIWDTLPTGNTPPNTLVGETGVSQCDGSHFGSSQDLMVVNGKLIVPDVGYNRVLIWNTIPSAPGVAADLVLGQTDFTSCTAKPAALDTLYWPRGVWSDGNRLVVADALNERVLIWNSFPQANGQPADIVLGKASVGTAIFEPTYVTSNGTQLFVSDPRNNRVLIWDAFPSTNDAGPNRVLGQGDLVHVTRNDDDQDGSVDAQPSARTLAYPHGLHIYNDLLFVNDLGNSRVLVFKAP